MTILRWVLGITFWGLIVAFFHYTLPQVDIVRITETENRRVDFGVNSLFWASADVGSDQNTANRDVYFILTRRADGGVMVYRNEDTGWGWPPYFKLDSSNLHAEASDAKSTAEAPQYYAIKHYGWRSELLTVFPNAISIRAVEGPDVSKGIPYFNIIVLTLFSAVSYGIWVRWRRFRIARIDPTLEAIEDNVADRAGQIGRWMRRWRKS
ncbi:MAG: DUF1523 family protein [Pseudomonadota bacterium]